MRPCLTGQRTSAAALSRRNASGLFGRLALYVFVRLLLMTVALGIFAVGFFRLPDTVTTTGELVIGEILAITVGLQMLVAALSERSGRTRSLQDRTSTSGRPIGSPRTLTTT